MKRACRDGAAAGPPLSSVWEKSEAAGDEGIGPGSVVLITGGTSGLGRALVFALARHGARVVLSFRSRRDRAERIARLLRRKGGEVTACRLALEDSVDAGAVLALLRDRYGRLDALVCNAAVTADRLLLRTSEAEWDRVMAANLTGHARLCRLALPLLRAGGRGRILFVNSRSGLSGNVGQAAYAASKAGLLGLARTLAREETAHGVAVATLIPGYMRTPLGRAAGEAVLRRARGEHLFGRLSSPRTMAACALLLLTLSRPGGVHIVDARPLPPRIG